MKLKSFITFVATALLLAGCSNDETETTISGPVELRLTSGVEVPQTRSTQETSIAEGEVVSVWVDNAGTTPDPTPVYEAIQLTATAGNGFTGSTTMYFPAGGTTLNIYAIHGNFTPAFQADAEFPASAITHTVENDQTSGADGSMANYLKSDLLYAVQKGVTASDNVTNHVKTQQLTFYHLLSKIEVALKAGTGSPNLTDATVTIEGTKLKADFTPSKDATMADASGVSNTRASMVTATASDNDPAPITIPAAITTNDFSTGTSYAEAIVVPQTIAKDAPFIKVELSDGTELVYKIPDTGGLELKSGKKYTYNITVSLTSLTVTSKIEPWESAGTSKPGDAVMQ